MAFPFEPPLEPMLSKAAGEIPAGAGWLYEPKWDGFRALIYRDGPATYLQSRNGQPLDRYFPELIEPLRAALPWRCVVDGEIIVPGPKALDFDALLQRIHPAASRIAKLSKETPASFVAFDLLASGSDDLRALPFSKRREKLEASLKPNPQVLLTPQTDDPRIAREWFVRFEGAGLDGIVAKRATQPYVPGERVMVKVKHERTADCVVGGYRLSKAGDGVASLLLGLYDDEGVLHHVGHTSAFAAKQRREILAQLRPLEADHSFTGNAPGGPSRWARGRELEWQPVRPVLVCEVRYDHLQGDRFRHASRFVRWRPDRTPESCTFAQLEPPQPFALGELQAGA